MTTLHACSNVLPYFQTGQRVVFRHHRIGYVVGKIDAIARADTTFHFEVVTPHGIWLLTVAQLVAADNVVAFPRGESAPSELEPSA